MWSTCIQTSGLSAQVVSKAGLIIYLFTMIKLKIHSWPFNASIGIPQRQPEKKACFLVQTMINLQELDGNSDACINPCQMTMTHPIGIYLWLVWWFTHLSQMCIGKLRLGTGFRTSYCKYMYMSLINVLMCHRKNSMWYRQFWWPCSTIY